MQTIKLTAEAYNSIVKSCKAFVDGKGFREDCAKIHLKCNGDVVVATALDGHKALKLTAGVFADSDRCSISMPVLKPVKAKESPIVTITADGNKVSVETMTGAQTVTTSGTNITLSEVADKCFSATAPQYSMYVNPKLLADALSSFPFDCVRLDFFGEVKGIEAWGMDDTQMLHALVMPVRCARESLREAKEERR